MFHQYLESLGVGEGFDHGRPPEPDLSMEVTEWLKLILAGASEDFAHDVKRGQGVGRNTMGSRCSTAASSEAQELWLENLAAKFSAVCLVEIAELLCRFYPDMPMEVLSENIRCVAHSEKLLCGVDPRLRCSLAALVPCNRREWLSEDVREHVGMVRGEVRGVRWYALQAMSLVEEPMLRATAIGAGGGALALGTAGFQLGVAAGAATGALVGVVPAVFTFGLSIPAFATIGGGIGGGLGATAGAGIGLLSGSALGGVGYAYRKRLKSLAEGVMGCTQVAMSSYRRLVSSRWPPIVKAI